MMKKEGYDQLLVVDETGIVSGMAILKNIMSQLVSNKAKSSDPVEKMLYRQFLRITVNTILGSLSYMLNKDNFVVVILSEHLNSSKDTIASIVHQLTISSSSSRGRLHTEVHHKEILTALPTQCSY
ncbi:hypothetical protein PR048_009519 [Dryococelus australis]|uniref:CBS domain-containing protein n=1 Tax=Dryococelus australis TaxID=614101 RepID=A0ABQ9I069_9NEOP|nr:hypothetical protein PR048_009519 [Dryococelus australis]